MNGNGRGARSLTLAVTNIIKVAGLIVALNELMFRPTLRPLAVAAAAFMMAGAVLSEQAILAVVDRIISRTPDQLPPSAPPKAAPPEKRGSS